MKTLTFTLLATLFIGQSGHADIICKNDSNIGVSTLKISPLVESSPEIEICGLRACPNYEVLNVEKKGNSFRNTTYTYTIQSAGVTGTLTVVKSYLVTRAGDRTSLTAHLKLGETDLFFSCVP